MKKDNLSLPAVGLSSLLVIFAVLCLTVFTLLSVSTVSAHKRLAQSSRQTIIGYYQADSQAEEILARLRSGEVPQGVTREGDQYTYSCPISDTQTLAVRVEVAGENYQILRWQAISTADWDAEDKLPVWNGEMP